MEIIRVSYEVALTFGVTIVNNEYMELKRLQSEYYAQTAKVWMLDICHAQEWFDYLTIPHLYGILSKSPVLKISSACNLVILFFSYLIG